MIESKHQQNGHANGENGRAKAIANNGHKTVRKPVNTTRKDHASKPTVDDLLEQIRSKNKTILDQSQRIEELESYLACITALSAKVKELELEIEGSL